VQPAYKKCTIDMMWEQIEERADQLRVEGGEATQIVARAWALISGAPDDSSSKPTNKAAVDRLMGAEKGTHDMTWEQIEEGEISSGSRGARQLRLWCEPGH